MNRRTKGVDMSSEAMDRRLRRLSDLWEFGQSLRDAEWLGKVRDLEAAAGEDAGLPGQPRRPPSRSSER
jgi:CHASE1-domain containing sensor protein